MSKNKIRKTVIVELVLLVIYALTAAVFHILPKQGLVILAFAIVLFEAYHKYTVLDDKTKKIWLMIIFITFLSSLPLCFKGLNTNGHDITFHIYRIEGIVHEITTAHFPAKIYSYWNEGYGYPTGIFYGDVLLYFPALLRMFGFSMNASFKIFVIAINLLTVLIAYISFRLLFQSDIIASVLVFTYCLNPYRLTDLYVRHSVGEYCAIAFFPLVALAFSKIISGSSGLKKSIGDGILLAVAMTGIITSHILSSVMVFITLVLFFLIFIKKAIKPKALLTFASSVIMAFLLGAFFVVPFLDYYINSTTYSTMTMQKGVMIQDQGLGLAELFTFFANDPNSYVQLTPGIPLMATLFLAIYLWISNKASSEIKIFTLTSLLFLLLPLNIFPWDFLGKYRVFSIFTQVQYPWRYLGIACLLLTLLLGIMMKRSEVELNSGYMSIGFLSTAGVALSILTVFVFTSLFAFNPSQKYYKQENTYFPVGVCEYKRAKKEGENYRLTDFSQYKGEIQGDFEKVDIIKNEGLNLSFYIKNGNAITQVVLPRTNYPYYNIADENGNSYEIYDSDNLCIAFDLPTNFDGNIYLTFKAPWYWLVAYGISMITALLMALYIIESLSHETRSRCAFL